MSAISERTVGCADEKRNRVTGCRGRGVRLALGASLTLVGCRVLSISLVTEKLGSSSVEAPVGVVREKQDHAGEGGVRAAW